ncbi:MAG TPA: Lrp/AsnC ligand binding domain-containing protein [Candidatus Deferrimicrobium sp.]|nr:Lrp/AsnC ligand binding domain-containing protein [Candidatus Deferrimicrobium sp.]
MATKEKTIAYLMVLADTGKEYEIVQKMRQNPEVSESYIVYGAWDVICKIETESMAKLNSIVLELRRVPFVKRSMTLIALTGDATAR